MAGKDDFTIETKLRIAGVEAKGDLDAGTLKFKVDTSSLDKLVRDAAKAAKRVKREFDKIKINKLKIEVNKNSLRSIESQIRKAIQSAVQKVRVDVSAVAGAAAPAGGGGAGGLPLPPTARTVQTADLSKEIQQLQQVGAFSNQVASTQIRNAQAVSSAQAKADAQRQKRIEGIKRQLDSLFQKEQKLSAQLGGAGGRGFGGGGGAGVPPGGFGAVPPGGDFDKSRGSLQNLQRAMAGINDEASRGRRNFDDLNELAFEVGRKAAAFRGVAIAINTVVNAAQSAASFLIEFNDSLRELNKILQSSETGLQIIGNELFSLSANTGVAVDQTLEIATEFARAGLEGRGYGTVVELTNNALRGLQGTTLDASQSTQILIQVIQQVESQARGLNKELITTGKLFDILGRAEDITASKAQDVADALRRSAASLFATGATVEEVTAVISVLQERTRRGGEVIGTALKTLASRIASSSSEASQALRSIGVETIDSEGKLRNIFDVLRDTASAFRNLSEAEQANIAVKAAGLRQVEVFRAALQDFNRLQDVQNELQDASGDAARKQAVEQDKLANAIAKIQIALQQLVKTASQGFLGQAFGGAIKFAEKLLTAIADLDQKLGGTLSTFGGFIAIVGAAKALVPLIGGISKAFSAFLGLQKEAKQGMDGIANSGKMVGNVVESKINKSMQATANIMRQLNQEMANFQKQTELAAVKAERLAQARKLAQEQVSSAQLLGDPNAVNRRAQQILKEQEAPTTTARERSFQQIIGRGGSQDLVRAFRETPEAFTAKERERLARLEKSLAQQSSKLGKALDKVGGQVKSMAKSSLLWGVALSTLSGFIDEAADKARDAGHEWAAVGASAVSTGTQMAAFGALFGPVGAAIGGVGGALVGLVSELNRDKDTIEELGREYVRLGLIQAENGKITSEAAKQLEKAFKNIKEFRDFELKLQGTQASDVSDPQKAANREERLQRLSEGFVKNFERGLDIEQQRQRILESASKITQERTGAGIDLTSASLSQIDDKALQNVTEKVFNEIIESFAALAASDEGAAAVRDRGAELLRTSGSEGEFGKGRVSEAGVALARALNEIPGIIAANNREVQDANARATREAFTEGQREAFGELRSQLAIPLGQASKLLGTPINKLTIEMRSFINDFGQEVLKLQEVTLRATTPQEQLANKLEEFARTQLTAAERREDFGSTDAINNFLNAVNQLPGAQRAVGRGQGGELLPGFNEEEADRSIGDLRRELSDALLSSIDQINREGIIDLDAQRKILEGQLKNLPSLAPIAEEDRKKIIEEALTAGKAIVALETDTANKRIALTKAAVTNLRNTLQEQQKELALNKQRREVLALNAQAAIEELTGIRKLTAQRKLEADIARMEIGESQERINVLDQLIAKEREAIAANQDDVAAQDKLKTLTEERTKAAIGLEQQLASERINSIKNTLAVARTAIEEGKKEADFQRSQISARAEIVDLLAAGGTQMEKFNRKLETNAAIFRTTQAELAAESAVVNSTITDEAEKKARLADISKRGAQAALEFARAEAEVIAERREAIKQISQELLGNQQEQVDATKAVIEATKGVSDAYRSYLEAVDGAILATTQYNLNLRLVEVQNQKLLGGFGGLREQIGAVQDAFRDAENAARQVGASEKTLVQIRRDSINQQLALFNQLLSEQSSLARQFFQSSAQEQADLFRGIQEAQSVAETLGGSFEAFKNLGEKSINELGAQLLALPQETRQRIIQSLETLSKIGGQVGGFSADELLTAIETASLGVSGEGIEVDPLFEVQEKIANLNEQQAQLATEQLISANEGVQTAKQQLEEAEAQKDLAEIQLERIKEEGMMLRGQLGQLQGDLRTVMLQQDQTARSGFTGVQSAVGRSTNAILSLPDAISAKIAAAFREVLSGGGVGVAGLTTPAATPTTRANEMVENFRQQGSNAARSQQLANQSGQALNVITESVNNRSQQSASNLASETDLSETNRRLDEVVTQLALLNTSNTTIQGDIEEINNRGSNTGTTAAATTAIPDINVNIQGQQQVTVTGFEAGVTRITAGLVETFGGFVTETEARNIAGEVVEAIRLQLERLGVIQRNQV